MKTHNIVIAGCGGMARTWVDYAVKRDNAEIVGLVDIREESAKVMAERFGLNVPLFTDLGQALSQTGANLVFDVTIPESHKQVVTTALSRGCDVFGEKPMAASMEEARELVTLAQQSGRQFAVMQNRRYLPKIRALRSVVAEGIIGTVGTVHADFFIGAHFGGFRDLMDSPLILDMAIHTFDQARFIIGADPVSVYCHEFNPPGSWYKGNASAICIFEMSDGSVFCYRGSWCSEGFHTPWEADWRVIGSKGTAVWAGGADPICEVVDETKEPAFHRQLKQVEVPATWQGREGHNGCLDEMFAAREQGRDAETVCSDNIHSMAMVFGAIESAKKGIKIML
ncbi:Gfo/Idh/MocA family protein [Paenibacillus allorhizosphaerae]|uniref:Inositol 2-dehydrogenase/D-chiro-inositol 3-dehydrogenase n=1 Tax=Paenibacillus allorhizosphaerae TaxID=2849866 RepID=A0ABM8VM28_9BACL|nr:Gfo/Idh/MocA family oxidoreductase [Paenibacillus allorhizosphaerae]CAG7649347.1 Inositol 2-dehydrogenase/D-chiro-inositol 3-dehydrogenase [Paenibacillus allorhizosphaerae]